ncbi:MAG: MMPL family transporter [Acidobacteria bacterium]|nr:MMPL family transporter [Acidobacteriota bacterium]
MRPFRIENGWVRLAGLIRRRPRRVFAISLLLLLAPAAAAGHAKLSYNVLSELPPGVGSVAGYTALGRHFDEGQIAPVLVVVRGGRSLWDDASFRAINDLTVSLSKVHGVAGVRSLTQPTGGVFTEEDLKQAGVGDLASFPDRLSEGADGVARVVGGLEQIRAGLARMRAELPQLSSGLGEAARGAERMRDGIRRIREGIATMRSGLAEAADGLAKPGARNDLGDMAEEASSRALAAFKGLSGALPTSLADPSVQKAMEDVGYAYGDLTGNDPRTGSPPEGDADAARYAKAGGMAGSLRAIAVGLRAAVDGLSTIDAGLAGVNDGLAELGPGMQEGSTGVRASVDGLARMIDGLDQILPGLGRLRTGLAEGAGRVRSMGLGDPAAAGNLGLTPGLIDSIPGLRRQLRYFVSSDLRTTRLFVTLAYPPYAGESFRAVDQIREMSRFALNKTPLEGAPVAVGGSASFFDDIRTLSEGDLSTIIPAVLLGIFLVLALLLRSLVAPVYLILTVALSFVSTLGLTTLVFQDLLGHSSLPWWLPIFLFVILVALGADYNIFLMSRIREESRSHPTAEATARGLALTGHVITSAGLILAGTFAAMMAAKLGSLQQMGFAVTVGVLLDTFIVRSLLVPSIATLLGRFNWWPSRRAASP